MILGTVGIVSGIASASTSVIVNPNLEWWQALLIACIPPVVGFLLDILRKTLNIKITPKQKEEIIEKTQNVATDLLDDGKLNNSHKKKENDK